MLVNEVDVSHRFYVMAPGEQITPVILGIPWQRAYNAIPIWQKDGIQLTVEGKEIFEPFLGEECYLPDSDDEEEALTKLEQEIAIAQPQQAQTKKETTKQIIKQPQVSGEATKELWIPRKLKEAQEGCTQIWIPKKLCPAPSKTVKPPRHQQLQPPKLAYQAKGRKHTKQRVLEKKWVKKNTLTAQGYYEGDDYIWLPKRQAQPKQDKECKPPKRRPTTNKQRKQKVSNQWIRKSTLEAQGYYTGQTQLWLPKTQGPMGIKPRKRVAKPKQEQQEKPTTTTQGTTKQPTITQVWLPKTPKAQQTKKHDRCLTTTSKEIAKPKATWQQKGKWVPKEQKDNSPSLPVIQRRPTVPTTSYKEATVEQTTKVQKPKSTITKIQAKEEQAAPPVIAKLKPNVATQARNLFLSVFNKTNKHKELA